jgi:ketohexokinase
MPRVMCVGVATLDIINRVEQYPAEDSEVRASEQSQRMGGNAANTATILAQLGVQAFWVGNLAQSAEIIEHGFARHGVDASLAVRIPNAAMPTSYILLSKASGSRSIVHFRDMPEYCAEDFLKLDLRSFDWVHFEGRAIDQLVPMLRRARGMWGLPVSLEVEKPRKGIEELFEQADLLLFSRAYALTQGFSDAPALLGSLPQGVLATCTWGAQGAWAIDHDGRLLHAAASPLGSVVDTLGAGDVFNAAMVHALSLGRTVGQALQAAVALASSQCGREGLELADE